VTEVEKIDALLRETWDKAKLPAATLDIECLMMNPPKPWAGGVMVQGQLIAIITLDEIRRVYARLVELEAQVGADPASHPVGKPFQRAEDVPEHENPWKGA